MLKYRCISTFRDQYNRTHYTGSYITHEMYMRLNHEERNHFTIEEEEELSTVLNVVEDVILGNIFSAPSDLDLNQSTPDPDTDSFGGFGGGESGGGGATGSWEPEPDLEPTAEDCWDGDSSDSD